MKGSSDAIASAVILMGIFIEKYFWWIDGVLGIVVAIMIFYATFEILKESISPLLGEKPDEKLISELKAVASSVISGQFEIHHIHVHRYGSITEVTFHFQFGFDVGFQKAHKMITLLENKIREDLKIEPTIHFEPKPTKNGGINYGWLK